MECQQRPAGNAHLNPLRDTDHGRVYIIEYTGKSYDGVTSIDPTDNESLIAGLKKHQPILGA